MRILYLTDEFGEAVTGGAGVIATELAQGMAEAGEAVSVIAGKTFPGSRSALFSLLEHRVKTFKPDIIHLHNIHETFSFRLLPRLSHLGPPTVITLHDTTALFGRKYFPPETRRAAPSLGIRETIRIFSPFAQLARRLARRSLRALKGRAAVSNALAAVFAEAGISGITVIHNGIRLRDWASEPRETEAFRKRFSLEGKRVLLITGRLNDAKGGEAALLALRRLLPRVPDVRLLAASTREGYGEKWLHRARALGVREAVTLTGWLPRTQMPLAYAVSHVVLVPSLYLDPFPTVNLEAMAAQRPVVGTCFGGTPEAVADGVTGYLVNPLQTEAFAARIRELLLKSEKARAMGEAGYRRVRELFTVETLVQKYRAWYDEITGRHRQE